MRRTRRQLRTRRMMLPSGAVKDYNASLNSGLLHAWPFDADFLDDKGSHDLTAYNSPTISTTTKLIGAGSLLCDYTNKRAVRNTTDGTLFRNNLTRSIVIWYRPTRSPEVGETFSVFTDLLTASVAGMDMYHQNNENLNVDCARKTGGVNFVASGAGAINIGSWNMIYFCHDADNDKIVLHLNNVFEDDSSFDDQGFNDLVFSGTGFGMEGVTDADWCDGYFDDSWMWNRALTDPEINWLWNGGAGRSLTIS